MTKTLKNPAALAKMQAVFQDSIDALKAKLTTASGYVLAWDTGLAVGYDAEDKPFVCGLVHAHVIVTEEQANRMPEEAWAYTPQIKNGNGEVAKCLPYKRALEAAIKAAEANLANFTATYG